MIDFPEDPDEHMRVGCLLMMLVFMAGVAVATALGGLLRKVLQ